MTQERAEGKAIQEEPVLFKEPEKKSPKGPGLWIPGLLIIAAISFFNSGGAITGTGTLKAQKYIKIQATGPGTLKEVMHKKGDFVQKDDVLARFQNDELLKELALKKKSLEISDEELKGLQQKETHFKSRNERATVLFENGVIGKSDFEEIALTYDEFRKKVLLQTKKNEALKQELDYLDKQVANLDLKAPFSGILLGDPSDKVFNYFKRGDDVLEFGDPATLFIEMPVRENQIEKVHVGGHAVIRFDALPSKKYTGQVISIGVKTDQEVEKVFKVKHVVICEIKLNEDTAGLRYGMQARIVIQNGGRNVLSAGKKLFTKGESYLDGAFKP